MSAPSRVTVIGAGIVGISCAEHLRRAGHQVTVIDRQAPGDGTSFGNAGVFASCAVVPVAVPGVLWKAPGMLLDPHGPLSLRWRYLPHALPWLLRMLGNTRHRRVTQIAEGLALMVSESVAEHQRLAGGTVAERWVRPSPYLYIYRDQAEYQADSYGWDLRRANGVRARLLRDGEVQEQEPAISPRFKFAVAVEDHGFSPDPSRLVKALAEHFVANGGTLLERTVKDIEIGPDGPRSLVTDAGPLPVEKLVVAAGPWSGWLAARLGSPVPLEAERGYHVTVQASGVSLKGPVMSAHGKFVSTSMEPGLRLAGLVEFAGLDAAPDYRHSKGLLAQAQDLFPDADLSHYTEWMGQRPSLPDSLPVIGRSPKFPSVYFAFGHQHVGLTGGPRTGRWIADLVSDREPNVDLRAFRVDRF